MADAADGTKKRRKTRAATEPPEPPEPPETGGGGGSSNNDEGMLRGTGPAPIRRRAPAPPRRRLGSLAGPHSILQEERVIVGVDIGIKNLSVARLRWPAGSSLPSRTDPQLTRAKVLLASARVAEWCVIDLIPGKSCRNLSHTSILDALVRCFRSEHPGIFTGASAVVIEVQRTSIMKMVQAALFVTARMQAPTDAEIVCQSGLKKLDFGAQDMAELCGKRITTSTYAQRKQAAVTLCNSLLRYLPSFAENADAVQSFEGSKKKDDYGDSLLHCLAYASDHLYC